MASVKGRMSREEKERVHRLYEDGWSVNKIAKITQRGYSTIHRTLWSSSYYGHKRNTQNWRNSKAARQRAASRLTDSLKRGATWPDDYQTSEALIDDTQPIFEAAITLTQVTGIQHDVDHCTPCQKGGSHHPENLQVMPRSLHSIKNQNEG